MRFASFFCLFLFFAVPLPAQQTQHSAETSTDVAALTNFHTVIYAIWHEAWPNKDAQRLTELLPDIESGVAEIAAAKLPGILREKQEAWNAQVTVLQSIAADYRSASEGKNNQHLLEAAEKLHMQYEKLVRVLRPSLKEIGEFHAELYMLYHYYMPGDSVAKMQESATRLQQRMAALKSATLPERLKGKEEGFNVARNDLAEAVEAYGAIAPNGDLKEMRGAIEKLHAKYQKLDDLLVK